MTDLPAMIDVRDNLEYVRRTTDRDDVTETLDTVDDRLERFAAREDVDRQGILDEIDNELLSIEQRTDGDVERRIRASRNRIQIYRDARAEADDTIVPVDSKADLPGGATTVGDATTVDGEVEFELTVVNEGETRAFDVLIAFTDDDGDVVELVEAEGGTVASNEEVTVTVETAVPDDATSYEAWARGDRRANG